MNQDVEVRFDEEKGEYRIYQNGHHRPVNRWRTGFRHYSSAEREAKYMRGFEFRIVTKSNGYHCMFKNPLRGYWSHCSNRENREAIFTRLSDAKRYFESATPCPCKYEIV